VADGVAFCPKCGAAVAGPAPVAGGSVGAPAATELTENLAGLLCYVLFWVTGIIFLLIDKRPFVRFHAAQSIVVFGTLTIIKILLSYVLLGSWGLFGYHALSTLWLWAMISMLVNLVWFVAWIALMVLAYQGKMFEVPIAAGIAKSIARSSKV
jgi:uncharacterized membrane protein